MDRPKTTVVLAMSADGKISDRGDSPARFSSAADQLHLETQVAASDAVMFGGGTLRAYGTSVLVKETELLAARQTHSLPPQPIHIVVSASGEFDSDLRFFNQTIPRWLLTTDEGATTAAELRFEKILTQTSPFQWQKILVQLREWGINRLAILGGGELVASLLAADVVDQMWLTVCPVIIGGATAPTPVEGKGFKSLQPLELLAVKQVDQEIFLHYRLQR